MVPGDIVIHLEGWRPHLVPLQTDGLMKHLRILWDMSLHNIYIEDACHGTAQPGYGPIGDHAMYDGPEEGDAGGLGFPVACLLPELPSRSLDLREILCLGQDSDQGAQEDAQTGRALHGERPI